MRWRHRIEVEKIDVVIAGIVIAADKPCVRWNIDSFLPQAFPYLLPVRHCGKEPCVRPAAPSSTGTTVVSRLMGIVEAGGAVAQDYHQPCEITHQASRTEHAGDSFCFFFRGESHQQAGECALGLLGIPHQGELGPRLGEKSLVQPIAE